MADAGGHGDPRGRRISKPVARIESDLHEHVAIAASEPERGPNTHRHDQGIAIIGIVRVVSAWREAELERGFAARIDTPSLPRCGSPSRYRCRSRSPSRPWSRSALIHEQEPELDLFLAVRIDREPTNSLRFTVPQVFATGLVKPRPVRSSWAPRAKRRIRAGTPVFADACVRMPAIVGAA